MEETDGVECKALTASFTLKKKLADHAKVMNLVFVSSHADFEEILNFAERRKLKLFFS